MAALFQYAAPEKEPISIQEAKTHLRVSSNSDDNYISTLIKAARIYAEKYTNRTLITQTWDWYLDYFCSDLLILPKSPVQSITSITYSDGNNETQTLSSSLYQLDIYSREARLVPVYGTVWPSVYSKMNAVKIRMVVGYGDPKDVPDTIKQGILVCIADMYDNRETLIKGVSAVSGKATADALFDTEKLTFIG